ncbi:unnamed protein product [Echinostoma caproni]|uniref:Uncharacterized protein n=1 Tax=Echinostoma caproni TaxID=27848 RepID=A0A183B6L6_9TREM|nr:unnamed protein product [Echinostoma caproni]
MPRIPVDVQTLLAPSFCLTKPVEDLTLVADRAAQVQYIATKGPPVTARPRLLTPDKKAFAKRWFDIYFQKVSYTLILFGRILFIWFL